MPIKSIDVRNVLVFQCGWRSSAEQNSMKDIFSLQFGDGINVLLGENGTGKTTLLKMIYAATQWSNDQVDENKSKSLLQFFSNNLKNMDELKSASHEEEYSYYKVSDGMHTFEESISHHGLLDYEDWRNLNIPSVFIPATEMLSHAKGFLALNQKFRMPFDGTQLDIIVNASLPETREVPSALQCVMGKISDAIGGTVVMEDDAFYVLKKEGYKVDFSLEAEGLRKLGLLWKLIRNGLLEPGSILLWDEPEANLNPELYPLVANILLELQKNGVQIFVATHSYNFAKYLEIRREKKEQVMFHNLYKDEKQVVVPSSAYRMEDLAKNHIMMAYSALFDEIYEDQVNGDG